MPGTSGQNSTYLEPDTHFGWGYLNAISEALNEKNKPR